MVAMTSTDAFKMAAENEEKYLERKRAAVQYLEHNEVPKRFQTLLNDVVVETPDDIFGYMVWKCHKTQDHTDFCYLLYYKFFNTLFQAEYFAGQAKPPTIANVSLSFIKFPTSPLFYFFCYYFSHMILISNLLKVLTSEVFSSRRYPSFQVEIQALVHGNIMVC